MNFEEFAIRLGIALALGAVMGLERQWHQRMAGTRTNGLVSAAAATFCMIGLMDSGTGNVSRIVGQIVTGVGFLGAGVIFKEGMNVHGLNTAATVWCSAAMGALCGFGKWQYALLLTLAVIITNIAFRPLSYKLNPGLKAVTLYHVELSCRAEDQSRVRALLLKGVDSKHLSLMSLSTEDAAPAGSIRLSASVKSLQRDDSAIEEVISRMSADPGVHAVSWRLEPPVE